VTRTDQEGLQIRENDQSASRTVAKAVIFNS
jgi:hypothetical protein